MKCLINLLIGVGILSLLLSSFVVYNPTKSIVQGFYFSYFANGYRRGDLIMFCVPKLNSTNNMKEFGLPKTAGECPNESPYLAKQIVAMEGDYIDMSNNQLKINGTLISNSYIFSEVRGITLYQANLSKRFYLMKEQFFVIGGSKYSYDSRYFGLITQADIYRKLKLIWHTNIYW